MIHTCLDTQHRSAKPNTNNGKLRIALFNNPVTIDPDTFVEEVTEHGKSFSVAVMDGNGSAKANFQSSMLFVLDIDNEVKGKPLAKAEQARLKLASDQAEALRNRSHAAKERQAKRAEAKKAEELSQAAEAVAAAQKAAPKKAEEPKKATATKTKSK